MPWFLAGMMVPWFAAYFLVAYGDREAPGGAVTFFLRAAWRPVYPWAFPRSPISWVCSVSARWATGTAFWSWRGLRPPPPASVCLPHRPEAKSALPVLGAKCGDCRMGFSPSMARFSGRRAKAHPTATPGTERAAKSRERRQDAAEPPQKLLVGVFLAALAFAVVGVVAKCWESPLGDWDAWAIWNLRARCLFRRARCGGRRFHPCSSIRIIRSSCRPRVPVVGCIWVAKPPGSRGSSARC